MLENKLGITNSVDLAHEEERITKLKALELFDTNKIDEFEIGTFKGLSCIHKYLFDDIYDFAGKFRTYNISKKEPILNGESVKYANYFMITDTFQYDFEEEKEW